MDVLRSRVAAAVAALAVSVALPACGDDDGKGAAEEVEKGAKKAGKAVKKGAKKVEKEGRELEDDIKGKDEKKQKKD